MVRCKKNLDNNCAVHIYGALQHEIKTDNVLAEFERPEMKECKL